MEYNINPVLERIKGYMIKALPDTGNSIGKAIYTDYTKTALSNMLYREDFSCSSVLMTCYNLLSDKAKGMKDAFVYYVYQYILYKSFPEAVETTLDSSLERDCLIYLSFLREVSNLQKQSEDGSFQSQYPMVFITPEEEAGLEYKNEYRKFIGVFTKDYTYEMMKLNQEIMGYNTLDHICGVHYLALHIARQLKLAGLPIDLGRVSGSAAGHDIGKYGCKKAEIRRVPYLHYYYTDQWFKRNDMPYIGHIAVNHSTWDLELESLSIDSLVLIYSDFRVKNMYTSEGHEKMHMYSLQDSFDVILKKLDNLDETKTNRYKRVYSRLKDFEDYMLSLNINVNPDEKIVKENIISYSKRRRYSLLQGDETVQNIKFLSISHNVNLMYKLRNEFSLNELLEQARSERDWKNLREYLTIFEEYSTHLTQKQKLITLRFLYDQLTNREDDIRRQSAELIGLLIATFDEEYRKEVPVDANIAPPDVTSEELFEDYIQMFIFPDHKIIKKHQAWIGNSLKTMIRSFFAHCRKERLFSYRSTLLRYYSKNTLKDNDISFYLLESCSSIPFEGCSDDLKSFFDFMIALLQSEDSVIKIAAIDIALDVIKRLPNSSYLKDYMHVELSGSRKLYSKIPAINFLNLKMAELIEMDKETVDLYNSFVKKDSKKISDIYLSNLKTATDWTVKKVQIDLLLKYTFEDLVKHGFYTAMHFCNLLKVSAAESVRNNAGEALLKIVPYLSHEQTNDVAIELIRALEIEGYHFTKYIPKFLGQVMLYLNPIEFDELVVDSYDKIKSSSPKISSLLLSTIGITVENYFSYRKNLSQKNNEQTTERLVKMLGILLNGFVHYDSQIKQTAFYVIGKSIFGSKKLSLEEKHSIFNLISKKILTLVSDYDEYDLLFFTNAAGLNQIYKFITEFTFLNEPIKLSFPKKVAFFPGTFDPFSLSHKEITTAIRNLGFEVYLQVDEFSWSKQVHPNLIRRNIINLSISDELNIYLFPEDIPVNISNNSDLAKLRRIFQHSEVYIVVGSDVIQNASSYRKSPEKDSIHTFSHIIFERKNQLNDVTAEKDFEAYIKNISGKTIKLSLPTQYEDISSTQIRNYIDENRDISNLVDPLAQKFIYENNYYRREPQYKILMKTVSIETVVYDEISDRLMEEIYSILDEKNIPEMKELFGILKESSGRILAVRDALSSKLLACSAFHWIRSNGFYNEFRNHSVSEFIRENAVGRVIILDGIFIDKSSGYKNIEQILLTETLSFCIGKDYDYAVFRNFVSSYDISYIYKELDYYGFRKIEGSNLEVPVYVVNMNNPCTLVLDINTMLKEPFNNNENINKVVKSTRKKLLKALASLYPGNLLLIFDKNTLYENVMKKVCSENNVPIVQTEPRVLGKAMCVPFGGILRRYIIPNTVTKSLHTEKFFAPDLKSHSIMAYPHYLDLQSQVKMLHSFNRPIILVDDLLHKGYRIKALDPILKAENINVQKIIVGILSGRGKELMDMQDREVDSAYFIPKLRTWFNESALYPFIGGDILWRGVFRDNSVLPSVNLILPYTAPSFMKMASYKAIYDLSAVCIENAIEIMTTIEKEYHKIKERNLTVNLMSEVFISPKSPDRGKDVNLDMSNSPTQYLQNDLEQLGRLINAIKNESR